MKCPQCGQWNRASLPKCTRCGADLTQETPQASWREQFQEKKDAPKRYAHIDEDGDINESADQRDDLASTMSEFKARKERGEARLEQMKAEAIERGRKATVRTSVNSPLDTSGAYPLRRDRVTENQVDTSGAADQPLRQGVWQDTRSYDPLVSAMQQDQMRHQPLRLQEVKNYRPKPSAFRRVLKGLLILLTLSLMGVAVFFLMSHIGIIQADSGAKASVTASIVDNQAAHTILIPGEDGQTIYVGAPMQKSYPVVGGFATVEIPDYKWYEDLPSVTEATMDVTLKAFLKTSGGRQKPLEPITYQIEIPLSPLKLVAPQALRHEVMTAMYTIQLNVRVGSTVTINGKDISDTINEKGELAYNASIQPIGDNVFTISVRAPYCRQQDLTLTIYREVQEIPLDLAVITYESTSKSTLLIHATTMRGATVDVLTNHSDLNITDLNETGQFSFYAIFDKIGDNTITITASYPGKKTSRVDYTVYYLPSVGDYSRQAWPLNKQAEYSELMSNMSVRAARSQVYEVRGVIAEFTSEQPQLAILYTSEDGKSRPVLLENKSKTTWEKGKEYRIYCDAYSTYNNMPWLIARYTYID